MSTDEILCCIEHYRAEHGKPPTRIVAGAYARRTMLATAIDTLGYTPSDDFKSFQFAGLPVTFRNMHGIELS